MTAQLAAAPLLTALFVGLLGGVHCLGMCGGIVSALAIAEGGQTVALSRQLAYNAGRIASYTLAGALAGWVGSFGGWFEHVLPVQTALYVLANALVILLGLYLAGWGTAVLRLEAAGGAVWRVVSPLGRHLLPAKTWPRALGVGLFWGWVPCGLTYSMVGLALVGGNSLRGAAIMAAFGLGTLPNLLLAGLAARRMHAWIADRRIRRIAGLAVVVLGVIGLVRIPNLAAHLREGWLCLTWVRPGHPASAII